MLLRPIESKQYTALSFSQKLKEVGITPSMGRTGTALDNAMAESFVSTLKAELVSRMNFLTRQAARTAIFDYLEAFYNTRRLHSALGYVSPADFEEDTMREARANRQLNQIHMREAAKYKKDLKYTAFLS